MRATPVAAGLNEFAIFRLLTSLIATWISSYLAIYKPPRSLTIYVYIYLYLVPTICTPHDFKLVLEFGMSRYGTSGFYISPLSRSHSLSFAAFITHRQLLWVKQKKEKTKKKMGDIAHAKSRSTNSFGKRDSHQVAHLRRNNVSIKTIYIVKLYISYILSVLKNDLLLHFSLRAVYLTMMYTTALVYIQRI